MSNEELVKRIKDGEIDLMNELYEQNLSMIKKICIKYVRYDNLQDLMQEAYFGLFQAVNYYDDTFDSSFLTYALIWIKQAICKYIDNCGTIIRVPSDKKYMIIRMKKFIAEYEKNIGRIPKDEEIASVAGISVKELEQLKPFFSDVASIDVPVSLETDNITIADTIEAECNVESDVVDSIYRKYEKSELWKIVAEHTNEKENLVLCGYYRDNKSLSQIAKDSNVTLERIRNVRDSGLRKLKSGKGRRKLIEKLYIVDSKAYSGGFNSFRSHNNTSMVEYIAIRREELKQKYLS